jgi:hypothetical protein
MPLVGLVGQVVLVAVQLEVVVYILEVFVVVVEIVVVGEHMLAVEIVVVGIVVVVDTVVVAYILDHTPVGVVEDKNSFLEVQGAAVVPDIVVDKEDTVVVVLVEAPFQEDIVLHS